MPPRHPPKDDYNAEDPTRLDYKIEWACRRVFKSDDMQAIFKQLAYEAASASSRRHLEALGIGSADPEENSKRADAFRRNWDFVTTTRERCEQFYTKSFSVIITVVVSGLVGGIYLLAKHFLPTLP
jgi:hypothetical protein